VVHLDLLFELFIYYMYYTRILSTCNVRDNTRQGVAWNQLFKIAQTQKRSS